MSYDRNFYNNRHGNEFTFHNNFGPPNLEPPDFGPPRYGPPNFGTPNFGSPNFGPPNFALPPPPLYYMPPLAHAPAYISDQEFVKTFENKCPKGKQTMKQKLVSISKFHDNIRDLVLNLNEIKNQEKDLSDKINSCSEEEWKLMVSKINHKKEIINEYLSNINDSQLYIMKKLMAKRTAKRLRLKQQNMEKRREKEDRIKMLNEKSRKIDENLQMIKDKINKAKQEEEAKLQADMVLREVLRNKHDARKFINKFDALKKLRKARQNTAKGRGENMSVKKMEDFDTKIDNLKALWVQKFSDYEKEENELRKKLSDSAEENIQVNEKEKEIASNLAHWTELLFGEKNAAPQFNFNGDLGRFVAVRCQWDQYINAEGSALPVGWVTPFQPA